MSDHLEIPYLIKADVGHLSDGSIALRLIYGANEASDAKDWEMVHYLLGPATARELAANLAYRGGAAP